MRAVLLCLSGALLFAQTADDRCVIEGQVVNGVTAEPLKKAAVILRREGRNRNPPAAAITDAAGQFTLKDIEPGQYWLSAERNGFLRKDGETITLERRQRKIDIVFKLT